MIKTTWEQILTYINERISQGKDPYDAAEIAGIPLNAVNGAESMLISICLGTDKKPCNLYELKETDEGQELKEQYNTKINEIIFDLIQNKDPVTEEQGLEYIRMRLSGLSAVETKNALNLSNPNALGLELILYGIVDTLQCRAHDNNLSDREVSDVVTLTKAFAICDGMKKIIENAFFSLIQK